MLPFRGVLVWMSVWMGASAAYGAPKYSLTFSRTWNTFRWDHRFTANPTVGDKLSFSSSFRVSSTLHRMEGGDRWRDDNASTLSLSYPFSDRIRLSVNLSLNRQKDDLSRNRKPILTQQFSSSISWKPFPTLSISQSAGGAFDNRLGMRDRGVTYSTHISISPKLGRNWSSSLSFSKSGNSLKREDRNMSLSGFLRYNAWIKPSIQFSEGRRLRKYYRTKKGKMLLESWKEYSRNVSITFSPITFFGFKLNDLKGNYSYGRQEDTASRDPQSAKFGADGRRNEWHFEGNISWALLGGRWPMQYRVSYNRGFWDYDKYSLDKLERELYMGFQTGFGITSADSVLASLSARINRIDTPDPAEYNDRDYLTEDLRASYRHSSPNGLDLTSTFSTHRSHTVYLSGRRSAGNKWSRQYSLSADLRYKIGKASVSQRYEIGADYTQYDYDDPNSPKSTVCRRASMSHRVSLPLGKLTLSGNYTFRAGDNGALYERDGRFYQAVTQEESTQTFGISCSYSLAKSVPFSFSYSRTRRWHRELTAYRTRLSKSSTLSANISYAPGGSNSLQANGSRTVQHLWGKRKVRWNISVSFHHTF